MPPASPAAIMLVNSESNTVGWRAMASASVRARFDVAAHLLQRFLEGRVRMLLADGIEALDQRQTGVEHDRELPGEDGDLGLGDLAPE